MELGNRGKGRVTRILGKVRESLHSINEGSARISIAGMRSGLGWVEDGTEHCIQEEKGLALEGESKVCLLGWGQ